MPFPQPEPPKVLNVLNDPNRKVVYRVLAYRSLSRSELLQSVAVYLRSNKGKHPKAGTTVQIVTIIGFDG